MGEAADASPVRRAVLCADDFAQTRGTVNGILTLVDACRLSAVSCLVESPLWPDAGVRLRSRPDTIDIGLHLNLTHDFSAKGQQPAALPMTIAAAYSRALGRARVEQRISRQFDQFEEIIGRPPDFVDGHHHVHQLPVVRDALIGVLRSRGLASRVAVRVTVPAKYRGPKGWVIASLGGRALLKKVRREGIRHNADFVGVYDFFSPPPFAERLPRWLDDMRDGALIMCHPGRNWVNEIDDPIAHAREEEFAYLRTQEFSSVLGQRQVELVRFRDLPPPREGG